MLGAETGEGEAVGYWAEWEIERGGLLNEGSVGFEEFGIGLP